VTPVVFVANTLISKPGPSGMGLLMILRGVPAYYVWRGRERKNDSSHKSSLASTVPLYVARPARIKYVLNGTIHTK
jgi:hypothetical protein